jgi:threonine-phosphate decarboxylase
LTICRERGWDWREVLDLSTSINPLAPPAGVRAAIIDALDSILRYPAQQPVELEAALGAHWRVPAELVLAGSGATELLHFIARAGWQGPTARVVPVWSEFHRAFPHALHLSLREPERWRQRGLLILSRPGNPTGEDVPVELVRRVIASREGPVLVDESFIEFSGRDSAVEWCESQPNLLVLRSLSKFYGLPGLRVGALVGSSEWVTRLRRHREPWMVNTLGQAAVIAALSDTAFAARSREWIGTERAGLLDQLAGLDALSVAPSVTNFLLATLDRPARALCDALLERRVLVRNCTGLPGVTGQAIRFAVGTREDNERFLAALREVLAV